MPERDASAKLRIYHTIYRLNLSFANIVAHCRALGESRILSPKFTRLYQSYAQELQAEINEDVVDVMGEVELRDMHRFGKARLAREKELRDPDDVFIHAEERRKEIARQKGKVRPSMRRKVSASRSGAQRPTTESRADQAHKEGPMIPLLTFVQAPRDPGRKMLRYWRIAPNPHLSTCATLILLVFSLCIHISLYAQAPVFAGVPDEVLHTIIPAHPEMPAQTAFDIAVIETNAPDYFASSDKGYRYARVEALIAIEAEQLKGSPDLRSFWYEFIETKAPELTEGEIDAIARQWWSDNGNQAVTRDERGGSKSGSFREARARFQIFRTGNEAQVRAARNWLVMAQMGDHRERFRLPPQMQGMSPLAHLLALDIAREATVYTGEEGEKLRRIVRSLLADKFMVEGDAGIAHIVSSSDVDAVLASLSSEDESRKRNAQELLEKSLKLAIDADLKRYAKGLPAKALRPH